MVRQLREERVPSGPDAGELDFLGLDHLHDRPLEARVSKRPGMDVLLLIWRVISVGGSPTHDGEMLQPPTAPEIQKTERGAPLAQCEVAEASVVEMSVRREPYVEFDAAEVEEEGERFLVGHLRERVRASEDVKSRSVDYRFGFPVGLSTHL